MAAAPKPGRTAQRPIIKITVRGVEATVNPADYGPRDDILVRKESKAAFGERMSLVGAFQAMDELSAGLDTVCLLWWLARRKAGDTDESLVDALDNFPNYAESETAIEFELVEEDDSGN